MENKRQKKEIRKKILTLRDNTDVDVRRKKSRRICEYVKKELWYCQAEYLLCYVNYKSEVETVSLIQDALRQKKRVYCPVVKDKQMDFYEIRDLTELKEGFRGILEPAPYEKSIFCPREPKQREAALMIMPGAVFDSVCHRIGYGGGYYDRYLKENTDIRTMALCFSFQLMEEEIPYEDYDIRPQKIITEYREYLRDGK